MKYLFAVLLLAASAFAAPNPNLKKHAVPKLFSIVSAPVVHPKRTAKQIIGSIVFAAESGVDVANASFGVLDKAFAANFKPYEPIHYLAVGSAKLDSGMEKAELYFFGESN